MLRLERHGDVLRLHLSSMSSRLVGYSASAYLVRGVLVDAGFPRVAREVRAFLVAHRPKGVVLTHWHEDHAGNAPLVASLGVPIAAAEATLRALREAPRIELYRWATWGQPEPLRQQPERFEAEGLQRVPTPGHSSDHHVVWDAGRETVFGGDLFIGVQVRIAHEDEDLRAHVRSLRAIADLRPRRLFDGHRGLIEDPVDALRAKADWIESVIGRIESLAAEGMGAEAIARRVLGRNGATHYFSGGHYSSVNLVRAALRAGDPDRAPV